VKVLGAMFHTDVFVVNESSCLRRMNTNPVRIEEEAVRPWDGNQDETKRTFCASRTRQNDKDFTPSLRIGEALDVLAASSFGNINGVRVRPWTGAGAIEARRGSPNHARYSRTYPHA